LGFRLTGVVSELKADHILSDRPNRPNKQSEISWKTARMVYWLSIKQAGGSGPLPRKVKSYHKKLKLIVSPHFAEWEFKPGSVRPFGKTAN
jgi:hypothetical protein